MRFQQNKVFTNITHHLYSLGLVDGAAHVQITSLSRSYVVRVPVLDGDIYICCHKYIFCHTDMVVGAKFPKRHPENKKSQILIHNRSRKMKKSGSTFLGGRRKKLSKVGPALPSGSSGGIKWSFTNEYINTLSSTTFLNSVLSWQRSLILKQVNLIHS